MYKRSPFHHFLKLSNCRHAFISYSFRCRVLYLHYLFICIFSEKNKTKYKINTPIQNDVTKVNQVFRLISLNKHSTLRFYSFLFDFDSILIFSFSHPKHKPIIVHFTLCDYVYLLSVDVCWHHISIK